MVVVLLLGWLVGWWVGGGGSSVQGEVGSRNDADVELGQWEGVCDMKRPAWNCVFQLKDKKI